MIPVAALPDFSRIGHAGKRIRYVHKVESIVAFQPRFINGLLIGTRVQEQVGLDWLPRRSAGVPG
jgi:hypothetical protein